MINPLVEKNICIADFLIAYKNKLESLHKSSEEYKEDEFVRYVMTHAIGYRPEVVRGAGLYRERFYEKSCQSEPEDPYHFVKSIENIGWEMNRIGISASLIEESLLEFDTRSTTEGLKLIGEGLSNLFKVLKYLQSEFRVDYNSLEWNFPEIKKEEKKKKIEDEEDGRDWPYHG